ncbi:MAG: ABC transporter permease subunit [Defluviitaleaceae bacterium]|nr:ABC transporter permease subunit [Defluviitaleaceae bacterium]
MKILKRWYGNDRLRLLLMALPFVIFTFMFAYVPLHGWIYAFYHYRPGIPLANTPFAGLDNFRLLFTFFRQQVIGVLRNTLTFAFLSLLFSPVPMFFAIMLNEIASMKFRRFVQTITTLPNFISWVIIFSLAFQIFHATGPFNRMLLSIGAIDEPTMLLGNVSAVYIFQTFINMWRHTGWGAIIYIAAITGIDGELYDAASVDGAGRWHRIRHITIPGLMPTYTVLFILAVGNILGVGFEQYFVFNNPMVAPRMEVIDLFVFRVGLQNFDFAFATVIGMLRTVVSIIILFGANLVLKRIRGYGII